MRLEDKERLVDLARTVRSRAYAPYSRFAVGAALLGETGIIYAGVNVENASYPVGWCAERSAISGAVTAGERQFLGIAIASELDPPAAPCGMCRQALAEFGLDLPVLLVSAAPGGTVYETSIRELLPHAFEGSFLQRDAE
jgi:cytidine deaminase